MTNLGRRMNGKQTGQKQPSLHSKIVFVLFNVTLFGTERCYLRVSAAAFPAASALIFISTIASPLRANMRRIPS